MIYTACRTCYSELKPQDIFDAPGEMIWQDTAPDLERHRVRARFRPSSTSSSHSASAASLAGLVAPVVRHRAGVASTSRPALPELSAATMLSATVADADPEVASLPHPDRGSLCCTATCRGRHPRRGRPVRIPCDAHEPDDDGRPARADPHVGPAPVHDGPVGVRRLFQLIRHEIFQVSPFLVCSGPEVRAARLLRRGRQPDEPLPDPAAQGQRPRGWAENANEAKAAGREPPAAEARPRHRVGSGSGRAAGSVERTAPDHAREPRAGLGTGSEDLLVGERLTGVGRRRGSADQRDAADLESSPARGEALDHRRHADRVGRRTSRNRRTSAGVS